MNSSSNKTLRLLALASVILGVLLVAFAVVAPQAWAAFNCTTDAEGLNDGGGGPNQQGDLTQVCTDYAGYPSTLGVQWNWDNISGGGASGDACSLYDTDGDGNANYAACVTVSGNPWGSPITRTYECTADSDPDKCGQPTQLATNPATCTVAQTSTDPFPGGTAYPTDTTATCSIDLTSLGAIPVLVDVCSYNSDNPNSDPVDCVVRSATGNQIIVLKVTFPGTAGHVFDFTITGPDGFSQTFRLTNGQSFATIPDLDNGTYTITEQQDTGWISAISCDNGTQAPEDNRTINVALAGETVRCTFANRATPTSVQLADFSATAQANSVVLNWETVNEINNLGFNVLRGDAADAAPAQVSPAMIPSAAPGSAQGAVYTFEDANVQLGVTYYYWLQDTDTSGKTTLHGPLSVTLAGPTAVGLNSFSAAASSVPTVLALGGAGLAAAAAAFVALRKRD